MLLTNGLPVLPPSPMLYQPRVRKKSHEVSIPQTIALSASLPSTPGLKSRLLVQHTRRPALKFQTAPSVHWTVPAPHHRHREQPALASCLTDSGLQHTAISIRHTPCYKLPQPHGFCCNLTCYSAQCILLPLSYSQPRIHLLNFYFWNSGLLTKGLQRLSGENSDPCKIGEWWYKTSLKVATELLR